MFVYGKMWYILYGKKLRLIKKKVIYKKKSDRNMLSFKTDQQIQILVRKI